MKWFPLLIIISAVLISSACAVHYNNQVNSSLGGAVKSNQKITYVDKAYGYSSVNYVFGIGGLNRFAAAAEAMRVLQNSVNLENGQFLDNITLDQRRFYFLPFYIKQETIISADVVEVENGGEVLYGEMYKDHRESFHFISHKGLKLNDQVVVLHDEVHYNTIEKAKIIQFNTRNVKIIFPDVNGSLKIDNFSYKSVFLTDLSPVSESYHGLTIGDTLHYYKDVSSLRPKLLKAIIIGVNNSQLFIENEQGYKNSIPIESVIKNNDDSIADENFQIGYRNYLIRNLPTKVRVRQNNKINEGTLINFKGNKAAVVNEFNSDTLWTDVMNVFTNDRIYNRSSMGRHFYKTYLKVGNTVNYISPENPRNTIPVSVIGFQFYRVLIQFVNGDLKSVSLGELSKYFKI